MFEKLPKRFIWIHLKGTFKELFECWREDGDESSGGEERETDKKRR